LGSFLRDPVWIGRRRRAAVAVLIGIAVGCITLLATSNGLRTIRGGRIGGDLPGVYGAARILRAGDVAKLYDSATQESAERDLFPADMHGRMPFPYPPFVALAYVPLTWFPFKVAYVIHVVLMALCVVSALAIVRSVIPALNAEFLPVVAASLIFYPLFRAVLGGQNTALSLLCLAGAGAALAQRKDFAAGVWTGVWLYKPQLALPVAVALLLCVSDRRRFLLGLGLVGGIYYLIGAALAGWQWPIWWERQAIPYAIADRVVNRENGISLYELASAWGVAPLGWIAVGLTVGLTFWLAWRKRLHPIAIAAFAAGAAVLISPHVIYYDGGLAVLGLIASFALRPSTLPAVLAIFAVAWLQPLRFYFPFAPVTVVVILSMVLVSRLEASTPSPLSISTAAGSRFR
jgi:hypothetical protein